MRVFWTKEEDDVLIKNYLALKTREIVKLLPNRTYTSIKHRKKFLNLKKGYQKAKINQDFFNSFGEINCAIAGFIAADGCISTGNRLLINISVKDLDFLKTIKNLMNYSGNIHFYTVKGRVYNGRFIKSSPMCSLQIWNQQKICEDLQKNFSITSRKTRTLRPPINIVDINHKLSYLSGLICGDGWVTWNKSESVVNKKTLSITFLGTDFLLIWIKDFIDYFFPFDKGPQVRRAENIYQYSITGFKAYIFSKLILNLNIPRLDRKWNLARDFINLVENNPSSEEAKIRIKRFFSNYNLLSYVKEQNIIFPEKFTFF